MIPARQVRITQIEERPEISVLIIGAGINGIGTFRDLALQGVDVLMVDQADYCSGASAASSHMVHGGIRYLENGEFRLVREAINERNRLIENAPHLVKPLPTVFPVFKWFSGLLNAPLKFIGWRDRPAERGAVVIKLGMTFYDLFSGKPKTVPAHLFQNRAASLIRFPELNPQLLFTGTYFDGSMLSPERIAMELISDSVEENPRAIPLNYLRLDSVEGPSVRLEDAISGRILAVKPQIVVNAGGPWIDGINQDLGEPTAYIGGTKGSHLILDHPELRRAIGESEFFFENRDGRIVLIFPMGDRVLVGTTDIRVRVTDQIVITQEEVDYFFDMIRRVFPGVAVDRSHIVFTFSGVRPLAASPDSVTASISRDHEIKTVEAGGALPFPVLSLVSGKWTTFRAFAEQAADGILERLGQPRKRSTKDLPIGGSKDYPRTAAEREELISSIQSRYDLLPDRVAQLFGRYGTKLVGMLEMGVESYHKSLESYPDYSLGEIRYILQHEDVTHLDDLILRRTMIGKLGRTTPEGLAELAAIAGETLDWSESRVKEEVDRVVSLLQVRHRMDFNRFIQD